MSHPEFEINFQFILPVCNIKSKKHTLQDQINGKRLHNTYKKNNKNHHGDCKVTKNNWSSSQAATR